MRNSGAANAGAFVVRLNGSDQSVASLAAGQQTEVWFPSYTVNSTATVDPNNQVTESNESNNSLTTSLPVPTLPLCPATVVPTTPVPPIPTTPVPPAYPGVVIFPGKTDVGVVQVQRLNLGGVGNAPSGTTSQLSTNAALSNDFVSTSPDGKYSAYIRGTEGGHIVQILNTANGAVTPLFGPQANAVGVFFGWGSNNTKVLYDAEIILAGSLKPGLWLVDVTTNQATLLVAKYPAPGGMWGDINGAAVSPDGKEVIFSISENLKSTSGLWKISANGTNAQPLVANQLGTGLAYSPDGTSVAFVANGLMVMNANGTNVRRIAPNVAPMFPATPAWSPDSRKLAFVTFDGPNPLTDRSIAYTNSIADAFKGANIHVVDVVNGVEQRLLTTTGNIDPAWSPDGKYVAFASNQSGKTEIWAVDAAGTNPQKLTTTTLTIRYPKWQ